MHVRKKEEARASGGNLTQKNAMSLLNCDNLVDCAALRDSRAVTGNDTVKWFKRHVTSKAKLSFHSNQVYFCKKTHLTFHSFLGTSHTLLRPMNGISVDI